MSLKTKTWISLLAGLAAGVFAVSLSLSATSIMLPTTAELFFLKTVLLGLILGVLLGGIEMVAAAARPEKIAALLLGCLGGALGGALGQEISPSLTTWLTSGAHTLSEPAQAFLALLGGASRWAVLGLVLGAALGGARRSVLLAWQTGLGGLLGGLLGGITWAELSSVTSDSSAHLILLCSWMAAGGFLGLGMSALPWVLRPSWMRTRHREHVLSRAIMNLGSDPFCDLVLRWDETIAPVHVLIEAMAGGRHHLRALAGGPDGFSLVTINGRPILGEQWLTDGDNLQIGTHTLTFHERLTRGALRLGPPQPQAWAQVTGSWQASELLPQSRMPAPLSPAPLGTNMAFVPLDAVPQAPEPLPEEAPLLGLGRDVAVLSYSHPSLPPPPAPNAVPETGAIALRAERGPYSGQVFVLNAASMTFLGRVPECELPLPLDGAVSRLHARITSEGDQQILQDAGSANGTFVNGRRLTSSHLLHPGDLIQVGATVFRCESA